MADKNYLLYLSGVINENQYWEAMGDGSRKPALVKQIYREIEPLTKGFFTDESWQPVHAVFEKFNEMGLNWTMLDNKYGHSEDGVPNSKVWKFQINFTNQNNRPDAIYGQVTASGGGSVQSPLDRYDVVVTMS